MWCSCLDSRTFYQKVSIKLKNSKMWRSLNIRKGCLEIHVHTCMCSEARCEHLPASPMSVLHLAGFFETKSLTELAHHWFTRLADQHEYSCLLLPSIEIIGVPPHANTPICLFACFLRVLRTRVLMLALQATLHTKSNLQPLHLFYNQGQTPGNPAESLCESFT